MELWHKFFTIRRKNEPNRTTKGATNRSERVAQQDSPPILLQKEGIRVLLFRECDTRGRKLLYDSRTVVQVPIGDAAPHAPSPAPKALFKGSWGTVGASSLPQGHKPQAGRLAGARSEAFAEVGGGYGYLYQQKEADTKQVGELVFGAVDLAYRGSCSKLHLLQEPPQRVLLSRTAPAPTSHLPRPPAASDPGIDDGSFSSSISSLSESAVPSASLEVPWGVGGAQTLAMKVPYGSSLSEGDSGFCGPPSPYSSTCGSFLSPVSVPNTPHGTPSSRQGSGSSLKNSGSLNSLQRRFLRSVNTSLEALGVVEEGGGRGASPSHPSHRRATKLGLAVLIELQGNHHHQDSVESWLFLHLGVIESAINKLQTMLHSAYLNRQTFVSATHAAVSKLQQDLVDLVSGPRLARPVWLGLLGQSPAAVERHALCTSFVDTLAAVLSTFDTKQTNFFVSKLLTAVLTHHLGWVSTVAPCELPPPPPPPPAATTTTTATAATARPPFSPAQPSWAERLSESHPYSAVWAQLCELSGAVGYPPRAARTILIGSDTSLLHHLLTILSYVIRCSQVVEQQIESSQGVPNGASALPRHLQASSSSSAASIATIVEEAPSLQREASLRHRRPARGGGRGQEVRGCANEGAGEQKEIGEGKRWMLNYGEDIVIRVGASEGGGPSSPASHSPLSPQAPGTPHLAPQGSNAPQIANEATHATLSLPPQTLSSCKTSFDLSSLACEEDEGGEGDGEKGDRDAYLPPTPHSSLYPPLHHLDDHRETFGPVVLEPGKIAEKVQKLFRSSKRETDSTAYSQPQSTQLQLPQPQPQPTHISVGASNQVSMASNVPLTVIGPSHSGSHTASHTQPQQMSMPSVQPQQTPTASTQPPLAPVPPPRTRRSLSRSESGGKNSGGLNAAGLRKVHPDCVVVPAKDILPEVEEGGKVLLLHHSSPPQPGSRLHAHSDSHINQRTYETHTPTESHTHVHDPQTRTYPNLSHVHTQSDTHIHTHTRVPTPTTHSHSDTHIHTKLTSEHSDATRGNLNSVIVTCLPHPVDTRRRVRTRYVGRESARDLTNLEDRTVYPCLSHLKEVVLPSVAPRTATPGACRVTGEVTTPTTTRTSTQTHRRHHSDPTNGLFTTFPAPSLQVLEEVEGKAALPHTCREGVLEEADVEEVEKKEEEKKEEEEVQEQITEKEDPVVIEMPKCSYSTTTTTTQRHGLAGSLLGGVLDHYASPFILHATTQTQRWEDTLRQDLSSAAVHSPLDPQLAEAVAVVADTDSWEVQVVSSHSYVVGGTSGSGLRVDASPLVSSITDSVVHLTKLGVGPLFIVQHFEELLSELYLKSQLLAQYLLGGAVGGGGGATAAPYHLPDLTRSLGLDVNDLPLLLAVASTHTPALTHMYGLCVR